MEPSFQRYTLVARAIVDHEIGLLGLRGDGEGSSTLTVPRVVRKYDLRWGSYHHGDDAPPRADQLIRNELNRAVAAGRLVRATDEHGIVIRDGKWVVYRCPS